MPIQTSNNLTPFTPQQKAALRLVMGQSGWDLQTSHAALKYIAAKFRVSFSRASRKNLWKKIYDLYGDDLHATIDGAEHEPIKLNKHPLEELEQRFYTKKQDQAINQIKQGTITLNTLADLLEIELPANLKDKGDEDLRGRIAFAPRYLRTGDVFFCTMPAQAQSPLLRAVKPLCIFTIPGCQKLFRGVDAPIISRTFLLSYVIELASIWRKRFPAKCLSISGSVGKTTTTEMCGLVVGAARNMFKIEGNQNTFLQICSFTQRLEQEHEVWVQEASGAALGQLEKSAHVMNPDVFIITNIGNGHIGNFGGRQENLAFGKLALDRQAAPGAVGIVNWDDPILKKAVFKHRVAGFAVNDQTAAYHAENVHIANGTISFNVVETNNMRTKVELNVCGEHNIPNALAAFAAGVELGIDREEIVKALASFKARGMRQNLTWLAGRHVYLDCYSATERSMRTAVETMDTIDVIRGGRKIAVLADIPSLGSESAAVHTRIGEMVAEVGSTDEVFFYGPEMERAANVAKKAGATCRHTSDYDTLKRWIAEETDERDLLCFKASHKMQLQRIVDDLWGTSFFLTDESVQQAPKKIENGAIYKLVEGYGAALISANRSWIKVTCQSSINGLDVRIISAQAFKNAIAGIVVIPDCVESIGAEAFAGCDNLASITLPANLKYIGESAFAGCNSLREVVIPSSTLTIDDNAFANCESLERVVLPPSLKTVAENAFGNLPKEAIHVDSGSYANA